MKLESVLKKAVILDPAKNMTSKSILSEVRRDPLTGRTARICHFRMLKWEKPDFEKLVGGTETWCPFCPEKVHTITPNFPPEVLAEGRLVRDDLVLIPNISPYDILSTVLVMGGRHFIPMAEFEPELLFRAFKLALEFFRRLEEVNHPESVYHLINWNYMPPSGSSIIHPHLQVFATSSCPTLMSQEIEAAKAYQTEHGTNFWDDLVEFEQNDGRRFLGRTGRTTWLSSYAPLGVCGDILAVVDGVCGTLELSDEDLADLALGLTRAMKAYDQMGIYSFNMNFFTAAKQDRSHRFHLLFSPRTFFSQALGTPDVGSLRFLYNESLSVAYPEEINEILKPHFQG